MNIIQVNDESYEWLFISLIKYTYIYGLLSLQAMYHF